MLQSLRDLDPARFDRPDILKAVAKAARSLAEPKGVAETIPNEGILLNTLSIQEAKDSSAIENIITTHDEVFRGERSEAAGPAAKEVENYRAALRVGFEDVLSSDLRVSRLTATNYLNALVDTGFLTKRFAVVSHLEQYYNQILLHGATYGDLLGKPTPTVIANATDIATGLRWSFVASNFDLICSDLLKLPLARAVAASSAVPGALSPVTLDNYGGSCGYREPQWVEESLQSRPRTWTGNRALQRYQSLQGYKEGRNRPYIHLVDGGLAGNLGVYPVVEALQEAEGSDAFRRAKGVKHLRRIVLVIVNAYTSPNLNWSKREVSPSVLALLLQAFSVPIDRYSYEAVGALEDQINEWALRRQVALDALRAKGEPIPADLLPQLEFTVINASFDAVIDPAEREYLLNLPTTLSLPDEAIDRLRAVARQALRDSVPFRKLVDEFSPKEQ
ncbi:Fic/DOC family N-terminal domain-containing protein [Variovorax saccharolyticus]|uniref:Fic/DOC family N-terminal domain-containing protein n=1 Tax=Variovorax saccharolyticus TaxID=3053516 RepID=UPI002574F45D|nr:Fic/DOC family N-terminal domain-containing protein [Variovorax sp. J31P216]MDM0029635.1 Fic/DOC family N-terminal domain-containing protein [Variovorax sp. J31P216]